MVYYLVLVLLVVLSIVYDIKGKTAYRDMWYMLMMFVFILTAGLRWRLGIDTTRYLYAFYYIRPDLSSFSFSDYQIGSDPLWVLLNAFVKSLRGRFFMVQLLQATIVNVLVFKYIKKHTEYIFTTVFFYAVTCYFPYNMEIMRGGISIVICLYANDFIMEKKWVKGAVLYVVALLFHAQTILILLTPLLFTVKLDKKGILVLIGAFAVGTIADLLIGNYVYLLDNADIEEKALAYADSEELGEGFGLSSVLLNFLPNMLYPIAALFFIKKNDEDNPVLKLEPFLILYLAFLLMKINFKISYRYVQYYTVYVNLFYANFFVLLVKDLKLRIKGIAQFRYLVAVLIFVPFFVLRIHYYSKESVHSRYFPYASVIDRRIDQDRENLFYQLGGRSASLDEY